MGAGTNMAGGGPAVDLGPLDALLPVDEGCGAGTNMAGPDDDLDGNVLVVEAGGGTGVNIAGPVELGGWGPAVDGGVGPAVNG